MAGIDSLGGAPQQRVDAAAKALEARLQGELPPAEEPAPIEPHDHEQTLRERPMMMASAGISGLARHVIVEGPELEGTESPAPDTGTPPGPSAEAWNAAAYTLSALADRLENTSLSAAERLAASKEFLGHAAGFLEGFEESLRAVDPEPTS
ncbi:MAG: hypothetical protein ACYS22_01290 [Planctomycetota bacterium]|jgi:hypothetical protein